MSASESVDSKGPDTDWATEKIRSAIEENQDARGIAIIIANQRTSNPGDITLEGCIKGAETMKKAFQQLRFATVHLENATCEEVDAIIQNGANYNYPPHYNRFAFFFGGHGLEQSICTETGNVELSEIVLSLQPAKAPKLAKMAKLFFFDCCRGNEKDDGVEEMGAEEKSTQSWVKEFIKRASLGNTLLAFACMPYFKAFADPSQGGFWTIYLAEELSKDQSVSNALDEANKRLKKYRKEYWEKKKTACFQVATYQSNLEGSINLKREIANHGTGQSGAEVLGKELQHSPSCSSEQAAGSDVGQSMSSDSDSDVEVDRATCPSPRLKQQIQTVSELVHQHSGMSGSLTSSPVLKPIQSPPGHPQPFSESLMDCGPDPDDFPPLELSNSLWIFGSKFTNLITRNSRPDSLAYSDTVTSARQFAERFDSQLRQKSEAIQVLIAQPVESLHNPQSRSKTLLNIAGMIQNALKVNPAQYSQWLAQRYSRLTVTERGKQACKFLWKLNSRGARIATTSFDKQLSQMSGLCAISYSDEYQIAGFLRANGRAILHLHGHFDEAEHLVFSQSDHDRLADNRDCCSHIQAMFRACNVVFVGFDWELSLWDPQLDLVTKMGEPEKCKGAQHFILVAQDQCAAYSNIKGVAVWPYEGDLLTYLEHWWKYLLTCQDDKVEEVEGSSDYDTLPTSGLMQAECLTQVDQWYDPASGSQHTSQGTGAENECTQEYPPSYSASPAAEKQRKRQRPTEYGVVPPTHHYLPQKKKKLPQYSPADNDYQELIMRHQPAFMELANLPVLLPHLKSRGLLTREESQYLNNDFHTEQNRLRKLLEYMEYKGQEGCKKLLEAIAEEKTHTGHRQLYQQLTGNSRGDEDSYSPPLTKQAKLDTSRPGTLKETIAERPLTSFSERVRTPAISLDDILDSCVEKDFTHPELLEIASMVTPDIIKNMAIALHGHGDQFDKICYETPSLEKQAYEILVYWYDNTSPGPQNRKTLAQELYKLCKARFASAVAENKYS